MRQMGMTTTKAQVLGALTGNDKPEDLVCYWRPQNQDYIGPTTEPLIVCRVEDLPTREFYRGFGEVEGEEVICFSPDYVYVKVIYDGSEWIQGIPRNAVVLDNTQHLPSLGGR